MGLLRVKKWEEKNMPADLADLADLAELADLVDSAYSSNKKIIAFHCIISSKSQ